MAMFYLRSTPGGEYYFVLCAQAGPTLFQSRIFGTWTLATEAIDACRCASPIDSRYLRLESAQRRPYFDMITLADVLLGSSELFNSPEVREEMIRYCRDHIRLAGASDETRVHPN